MVSLVSKVNNRIYKSTNDHKGARIDDHQEANSRSYQLNNPQGSQYLSLLVRGKWG